MAWPLGGETIPGSNDIKLSRETAMKAAAAEFVEVMKKNEIPVVVARFDKYAATIDPASIISQPLGPGTNIYLGMKTAHLGIEEAIKTQEDFKGMEHAVRFLIILTDGSPTHGPVKSGPASRMAQQQLAILDFGDQLRADFSYKIFTIGIGPEHPAASNSPDPYLIAGGNTWVRPFFLRRLANDPEHNFDPQFPDTTIPFSESVLVQPGVCHLTTDNVENVFSRITDYITSRLSR